jgi:hypothetical protein
LSSGTPQALADDELCPSFSSCIRRCLDALAFNAFAHGLVPVLEEGGLLAKHVLMRRKQATLWAYV